MTEYKPWTIKILNGPHAGGQLIISEKITVGSSPDCDLVLTDAHISPLHCRIGRVADDCLEVIAEEGIVYVDGKKIDLGKADLATGHVLTLGSTHLTGGPLREQWPPVVLPDLREVGGVMQHEVKKAPSDALPETEVENHKDLPKTKTKKNRGKMYKLSAFALVAGVALLAACGSIALIKAKARDSLTSDSRRGGYSPSKILREDHAVPPDEGTIVQEVATALRAKINDGSVSLIQTNGRSQLIVYARGEEECVRARKLLNKQPIPIPSNIIDLNILDASATTLVQSLDLPLKATTENSGKVVWSGYVPDEKSMDLLRESIANDLPTVAGSEFDVVVGTQVAAEAEGILHRAGFSYPISFKPENDHVAVNGEIPTGQTAQWEKAFAELNKQIGAKVKLIDNVVANQSPAQSSPLLSAPIASVMLSGSPWVELQNGERIFVGAQVHGGYYVQAITSKGISLVGPGGEVLVSALP